MTQNDTNTNSSPTSEESKKAKGRPKGLPKTGGRQKGTKNKLTSNMRKRLELQLEPFIDNLGLLITEISEPKERVQAIAQLLPFVAPKMAAIDLKTEQEQNVSLELSLVALDEKFSEKKAELEKRRLKLIEFS